MLFRSPRLLGRLAAQIVFGVVVLAGGVGPVRCEQLTIKQAMSGSVPLAIKAKDLTTDWRTFHIAEQAGLSELMGAYGQSSPYYTKGEQLMIGHDTYLIAYHVPDDASTPLAYVNPMGPAATLTSDSELRLTLVNVSTEGGLTDIQPFDPKSLSPSTSADQLSQIEDETIETHSSYVSGFNHTSDDDRLRDLWMVILKYVEKHDGRLPPMHNASTARKALTPYASDRNLFTQIGTKLAYRPNPTVSERTLVKITNRPSTIIYYTEKPDPCGCHHALFADGSAHEILPRDWPVAVKKNHLPKGKSSHA